MDSLIIARACIFGIGGFFAAFPLERLSFKLVPPTRTGNSALADLALSQSEAPSHGLGVGRLINALAWTSIALVCENEQRTIELIILSVVLFVGAKTDIRAYKIPDTLVICCIAGRLACIILFGVPDSNVILRDLVDCTLSASALTAFVTIVSLALTRTRTAMPLGGGDIKLLFAVGLFFPWTSNVLGLLASCIFAIAIWAGRRIRPQSIVESGCPTSMPTSLTLAPEDDAIPFGAAIALGFWSIAIGTQAAILF